MLCISIYLYLISVVKVRRANSGPKIGAHPPLNVSLMSLYNTCTGIVKLCIMVLLVVY